jgi:Uma2 family endonuclease
MAAATKPYYTEAEYLARERRAEYKSEYYRGEIFSREGATREHNLVAGNVLCTLANQLAKLPCEVYPSDMRVRLLTGLYTYPDVSVACGEPKFLDAEVDTLLNPNVIVEVLSESTAAYDRGEKSRQYRNIESLSHYVLVESEKAQIEVYTRQPNQQWLLSEASGVAATIDLPAINCRLVLAEVYEKVVLKQEVSHRKGNGPAAADQTA